MPTELWWTAPDDSGGGGHSRREPLRTLPRPRSHYDLRTGFGPGAASRHLSGGATLTLDGRLTLGPTGWFHDPRSARTPPPPTPHRLTRPSSAGRPHPAPQPPAAPPR